MIKDPKHIAETPYEVLGLPFEAPLEDVRQALPRFMRDPRKIKKHGGLGPAQEAVRKLQNAIARTGIDIWLYQLSAPEEVAPGPEPGPLILDEFLTGHAVPPQALYCDLEGADLAADSRVVVAQTMRIADIKTLDGLDAVRPRPGFDR